MISISKNLRSAAIVATAIGALAGTGALAQNMSTQGATHANAKSFSAPNASSNSEASETPDVNSNPDTPEASSSPGAHGLCVSAVAKSDATATAHGHTNHGAAVSHAARVTCTK